MVRKFSPYLYKSSFLFFLCFSFLYIPGYQTDIGVMSGAVIYIQQDFNISDVQVEILVGIISLYAIIGAAAAGITSDWIGRRYTIVLCAALFFVGAILMGFAPNYAFLMSGRFVAGVAVGSAALIASVYTAEVAPTSSRGCLSTFPEVCSGFKLSERRDPTF